MTCKYCGNQNPEGARICANCGSKLEPAVPSYPPQTQQPYAPRHAQKTAPTIPPEYKPLSPWAYFGYNLLFSIPLVGFILLIVFSCGGTSNLNLKNYARSFWCSLLIGVIIFVVFFILGMALGISSELF